MIMMEQAQKDKKQKEKHLNTQNQPANEKRE